MLPGLEPAKVHTPQLVEGLRRDDLLKAVASTYEVVCILVIYLALPHDIQMNLYQHQEALSLSTCLIANSAATYLSDASLAAVG